MRIFIVTMKMRMVISKGCVKKTPYKLFRGVNILYLNAIGYKCFIYSNGKENLGKFGVRSNEGIFLGYSNHDLKSNKNEDDKEVLTKSNKATTRSEL